MHNQQFDILLRFFKALANESRLTIFSILANRECSVEDQFYYCPKYASKTWRLF
jgi:DNA-binding transcriptional ArsR family regulator